MISPAKQHFHRVTAAQVNASDAGGERTLANANHYELMLGKLAQDKRRLSDVQSMETRAKIKAELLPEYEPWIQGVLEGNQGVQDDVLMTVMVWHIDAGQLFEALKIAAYAIQHKLKMPDQYKRSTAVVVAEEVADACIKDFAAGSAIPLALLQQTIDITDGQDMPDEVKAKLYKALGFALLDESLVPSELPTQLSRMQFALDSLRTALALHDKVGVKKDIEKLERDIKNSADA